MLTKLEIQQLAIEARLPANLYNGVYWDKQGKKTVGVSPVLIKFTRLIEAHGAANRDNPQA